MIKQFLRENAYCVDLVLFIILGFYLRSLIGLWGVAITLALFCGYSLWLNWDEYIFQVRMTETQLFGKPLDKQYWPDGIPKVRFVWKKNKENKK